MAGLLITTIGFLAISSASASSPVMRRDKLENEQVSLSGAGALHKVRNAMGDSLAPELTPKMKVAAGEGDRVNAMKQLQEAEKAVLKAAMGEGDRINARKQVQEREKEATEYCNFDFPMGVDKTNHCVAEHAALDATQGGQTRVASSQDCQEAASQSGAYFYANHTVPALDYDFHPSGCFKELCNDVEFTIDGATMRNADTHPAPDQNRYSPATRVCYYWNPTATAPTQCVNPPPTNALDACVGTPVCVRHKIVFGETLDGTPPASNGGCPANYEVVRYQSTCHRVAGCTGVPEATLFRTNVQNASLRNIFPDYCYKTVNALPDFPETVFFNAPREGMGTPEFPVGIPICNVSTITLWNALEATPEVAPFDVNRAAYEGDGPAAAQTQQANDGSGSSGYSIR